MGTAPQDASLSSPETALKGDTGPEERDTGPSPYPVLDRVAQLDALRDQVRRLERGAGGRAGKVLSFGLDELDGAFPDGGLPLGCLHEIAGSESGSPSAFAALLLARLAEGRPGGRVLWILRGRDLHAAGLVSYGLTPGRLIALRAERQADALWAMEEALRCNALSAVLAELDGIDMIASRRLQLAAESSGVTGFLLGGFLRGEGRGQGGRATGSSVAVTRWRIGPAPSRPVPLAGGAVGLGEPRWRVALERCRGGRPGDWLLEWRDGALAIPPETGHEGDWADRVEDYASSFEQALKFHSQK